MVRLSSANKIFLGMVKRRSFKNLHVVSGSVNGGGARFGRVLAPDGGEIAARRPPAERFRECPGGRDDFGERHPRLDPQPLEQIEEVLRGEVSRRSRGIGAAPEPPRGGIVG